MARSVLCPGRPPRRRQGNVRVLRQCGGAHHAVRRTDSPDQGDTASYQRVRDGAWAWLMKYPMRNNVWVGYFEDVQGSMDNMNQVIPLEFARYVLLHPDKDPEWREHARQLIDWVKTTPKWPKYIVHGATVTTEQGNGKEFCCNLPNQCCDSHSARLAAVKLCTMPEPAMSLIKRRRTGPTTG